jgi:hypothetical protein
LILPYFGIPNQGYCVGRLPLSEAENVRAAGRSLVCEIPAGHTIAADALDHSRSASEPCRRRIFESALDSRLIALDAATGKPCSDLGDAGQVTLRNVRGYTAGRYHMTSPPAVIDDIVIVGSAIDDNQRVDMPAGVVRAFDVRTVAAVELGSIPPTRIPQRKPLHRGRGTQARPMHGPL